MTSIGDRIKAYEACSAPRLTPNTPVIIRVDGRAFHTWTRGMRRPFDPGLMKVMVQAATETAREMQGFKLGYVQSDEATFLLTDYDTHETAAWFGNEVNKLVSLSASLFTGYFNAAFHGEYRPAAFDSRAFTVPREDAPNVFVWRQQDWARNSLQMVARAHFSHNQLHRLHRGSIHDMLHGIGVNWATDFTPQEKNGTFILSDKSTHHDVWRYEDIQGYLQGLLEIGDAA